MPYLSNDIDMLEKYKGEQLNPLQGLRRKIEGMWSNNTGGAKI